MRAWLLLVACALPFAAAAETHTVRIANMQFVPAVLTVHRGDRIVWQNGDLVPHTATAAGVFDSGVIAPGHSVTRAAGNKGRHPYVCTLHPGMKGEVVVQ
jgi:plastocyanin